jgi:DNA polymerase IV
VFVFTLVLHADVDAFFASVERRDDPRLTGCPLIVGTHVVMAASYEARAFGIHGGMREREARRRCPDAVWVPPRSGAYMQASRDVFAVFRDVAAIVEPGSLEEAFLDMADARDSDPHALAVALRARVRDEVGLPLTVGAARSKVLAKLASRAAKPEGVKVIPPEAERAFLDPLNVEDLWGVGPKTAGKLHRAGITTVAELARRSLANVSDILGKASGREVHALAAGRDLRPVQPPGPPRSFGASTAYVRASMTLTELRQVLDGLVVRACERMRAKGYRARTVVVQLQFVEGPVVSRSVTLAQAIEDDGPFVTRAGAGSRPARGAAQAPGSVDHERRGGERR